LEGDTWIYSIGETSVAGRVAESRVAGNAFGTMLIELRRRALVMTRDEMDTAPPSVRWVNAQSSLLTTVADAEEGQNRARTHTVADL
jgi:hypothetical protein